MVDVLPQALGGVMIHRALTTADTPVEFAAIGHIRGWCHDSDVCPICKAERPALDAAVAKAAVAKAPRLNML